MREGKLALMRPVITSTEGLWVARIRSIPTPRAIWASRVFAVSTSAEAVIMRSASSSMITTRKGGGGRRSPPHRPDLPPLPQPGDCKPRDTSLPLWRPVPVSLLHVGYQLDQLPGGLLGVGNYRVCQMGESIL